MAEIEDWDENDDGEDPRIAAAEYERLAPEVETGPDYARWHYPDPHWRDPEE